MSKRNNEFAILGNLAFNDQRCCRKKKNPRSTMYVLLSLSQCTLFYGCETFIIKLIIKTKFNQLPLQKSCNFFVFSGDNLTLKPLFILLRYLKL